MVTDLEELPHSLEEAHPGGPGWAARSQELPGRPSRSFGSKMRRRRGLKSLTLLECTPTVGKHAYWGCWCGYCNGPLANLVGTGFGQDLRH